MKLEPDDLVMVTVKALVIQNCQSDGKILKLGDQPVFKDATPDNNIRVLHRNMLFPLKTSEESSPKESENVQNIALMKANLLMDTHFNN